MRTSGPKLPGYTVERLLGRGGTGEVWSARVSATGERVALKWISHAAMPAGPREAALLTALDHPHLVRLHDVVPQRAGAALVLDVADGGSLAQLLAVRGRLAPGEVITALAPVGSALAHAHANGVVHGDVTPGNILFSAAGLPMLADLGIARLRGDVEVLDGTHCTPQYVDPSVVAGSVPGAPSDVFMLAAVAVHALTGSPVWLGDSADLALDAARAADLSGLAERLQAAFVPPAIAATVLRAASVDPAARGTAAEFALDLRSSAEPVPIDLSAGRRHVEPSTPHRADSLAPRTAGPRHARPVPDGVGASAVFTRLLGSPPRPAIPDNSSRARSRRRIMRWSAALIAVVAVLGGAGAAWASLSGGDTDAHRVGQPTATIGQPGLPQGIDEQLDSAGATETATASPASATATPLALTAAQTSDVLAELDVLREHAFSRRAPLLLTGVYPTGPLLNADTALLAKVVPDGCGLEGVRTAYDNVTIRSRTTGAIVVSARVTLSPSVLVCAGKATAQAAGSAPETLRITLVWRGNGYLIGDVRR